MGNRQTSRGTSAATAESGRRAPAPDNDPRGHRPVRTGEESWLHRGWFLLVAAILVVSARVYLPALAGGPIWDDRQLIGRFPDIHTCLTRPFLGLYFRPCVAVSFWLDGLLFGREPYGYHLVNVLFHALATWFWILFLKEAYGNRAVALAGGLLFAVQPAQVGAVAWIGGRTDSLCILWVAIFSWLLARSARKTGRTANATYAAAMVFFGLAVFTKEQALALLPLVPLGVWLFSPGDPTVRSRLAQVSACVPLVIAGVYAILCSQIAPALLSPTAAASPAAIPGVAGRTTLSYVEMLALPSPSSLLSTTDSRFAGYSGLWTALGWAATFALIAAAAWLTRRRSKAAWLCWFVIVSLAPVSNVIPLGPIPIASYRAALPATAVTGLIAVALCSWRGRLSNRIAVVIGAAVAGWYACLTYLLAGLWIDEATIDRAYLVQDPRGMFVAQNYANALMEKGRPAEGANAIEHLIVWILGPSRSADGQGAVQAVEGDPAVRSKVRMSAGLRIPLRTALSNCYAELSMARLRAGRPIAAGKANDIARELQPDNPLVARIEEDLKAAESTGGSPPPTPRP